MVMSKTALEKKRAYNREYMSRPDIKEKQKEYRRQWRAKKKSEDPEHWKREAASDEIRDAALKRYRENHREELARKAREYHNAHREKQLEYQKQYRTRKKAEDQEYFKKENAKKDPKKIKARSIAAQIEKDDKCEKCGSIKNLEKHHPNYDQPKIFLTLCKSCHAKEHKKKY